MGNNFSNNEEDGPTEGNNCFLLCNNLSMTFAKKQKWREEFKTNLSKLPKHHEWKPRLLLLLKRDLSSKDFLFKSELLNALASKENEINKFEINKFDDSSQIEKSFELGMPEMFSAPKSFLDNSEFQIVQDQEFEPRPFSIISPDGGEEVGEAREKAVSTVSSTSHLNHLQNYPFPTNFISFYPYEVYNERKTIREILDSEEGKEHNELYLNAVKKFVIAFSIIERHFQKTDNILNSMRFEFSSFFKSKYGKILQEPKNEHLSRLNKEILEMTNDLKTFVWILKDTVKSYYSLDEVATSYKTKDFLMFSSENLITFLLSMIITDDIYEVVFGALRKQDQFKEVNFRKNIFLLNKLEPTSFLVQDKFCLDDRTRAYFQKTKIPDIDPSKIRKPKIGELSSIKTKIFPHLLLNSFQNSDFEEAYSTANALFCKPKAENSEIKINYNFSFGLANSNSYNCAFYKAIDILRNIGIIRNPAHKLKLITIFVNEIRESIREFYKANGIKENSIKIETDDLIAIVAYLVCQAGIGNLLSQISFIEKFFNENNLNGRTGFCFYSLKVATEYVMSAYDSE